MEKRGQEIVASAVIPERPDGPPTSPPPASGAIGRRWWVTKHRSYGKVLGPFATADEAVANRVAIEEYSGKATFWVWEFPPEDAAGSVGAGEDGTVTP